MDVIYIGVSPGGTDWIVYRANGESDESMFQRATVQRARLARLHARALVRVDRLTQSGIALIEDSADLFEGTDGEAWQRAKIGGSYIVVQRATLEAIAESLADRVEDHASLAACGDSQTDQQIEFAERSARKSVLVAICRIMAALEGKPQPKKVAIPKALLKG